MEKIQEKFSVDIKYRNILILMLPVVTGGVIYILWRPVEPVFFEWIKTIGLENGLNFFRDNKFLSSFSLPGWFIYSLPGGLWAFAYSFIISKIWIGNKQVPGFLWMASIPLLVFGLELLQLTEWLPGTFCFEDLLFGAAGIVAGIITACKTSN